MCVVQHVLHVGPRLVWSPYPALRPHRDRVCARALDVVSSVRYSGSDCSVVASGNDDESVVLGAYPGSWGECDTKCGGGTRRVLVLQCNRRHAARAVPFFCVFVVCALVLCLYGHVCVLNFVIVFYVCLRVRVHVCLRGRLRSCVHLCLCVCRIVL